MDFEKAATKIIHYCFYALFFTIPLIFIKGHVELFQFNKMMTVYLATTIITSTWLIKIILQKRFFVRRTPLDIPILLFLLSQILSTIFSIEPHTSLWGYYSRFHGGLLSTISYILLYYAFVSNASERLVSNTEDAREANFAGRLGQAVNLASQAIQQKHRNRTVSGQKIAAARAAFSQISINSIVKNSILVFSASATIVALYGILEHFGIDEHLWVQDVRNRVFSTLGQPNWLAAFLVIVTPLTFLIPNFLYNPKKLKLKSYKLSAISYLLSAIFYLTLLYTKSRSGLLGFAVMYAIFWGLLLLKTQKSDKPDKFSSRIRARLKAWLDSHKKSAAGTKPSVTKKISVGLDFNVALALEPTSTFLKTSILILIITLLIGTPFTPNLTQIAKRLTTKPAAPSPTQAAPKQPVGGTPSEDIRKIVWSGAIKVWKNWPILGSGVETFAYSYYNFRPVEHNFVSEWDFLYNKAHNEYLNFLSTTGLFGLGSYLLLQLWYALWSIKIIYTSNPSKIRRGQQILAGRLGQALSLASHAQKRSSQKQPSAAKRISVASDKAFLIALLSGYAGLSVSNFFGFSTVTTGLLFFMFPAFAVVVAEVKPRDFRVRFAKAKEKARLSPLQIVTLISVFILSLSFTFQIGKRWYADRLFARGKRLSDSNYLSEALIIMQKASTLVPNEPLFHDRLALDFARSASALFQSNDPASALQLSKVAAVHSDITILQNPIHLNYLKNRAATMLHLAAVDPKYKQFALQALKRAAELSPTDPKIPYNLGLIYVDENQLQKAIEEFKKALELKPDYDLPRIALAAAYEQLKNYEQAIQEYQSLLEFYPEHPTATQALQRLATDSGKNRH